jgi:hypothetical protein
MEMRGDSQIGKRSEILAVQIEYFAQEGKFWQGVLVRGGVAIRRMCDQGRI